MPEEVLFEFEQRADRSTVAAHLRTVADNLESGEPVTLGAGEESITVAPPSQPTFEIKVERETSSSDDPDELSVEFELEWKDGQSSTNDDLSIE